MSCSNIVSALSQLLLVAVVATPSFGSPKFGNIPLHFEANYGQADPKVYYLARSGGMVTFVLQDGIRMSAERDTVSMQIRGTSRTANIVGGERLDSVSNYYLGRRAITGIPHFDRVHAYGVQPGVDVVYYGRGDKIEYDLVFSPESDPSALRLRFTRADRTVVADNGDLVLQAGSTEFRQLKPQAWQEIGGVRRSVECHYALTGSGEVGFTVGTYDRSATLTIDPILTYSTYVGGSSTDRSNAIAVDGTGAAYITGITQSNNFPVTSGSPSVLPDAFVTKLNASGTGLIYSTYLGGSLADEGRSISVDGSNNAYVIGTTSSGNFPTTTGPTHQGGRDTFVVKLNSSGTIVYARLIGGSADDHGEAIKVDSVGNAYIAGNTLSNGIATVGAYRTALQGGADAFIAKLSTTGATTYLTYMGGNQNEEVNGMAIDGAGQVYVTGYTASPNFPLVNAIDISRGGNQDAFVTVVNSAGSNLAYSSFLGGSGDDAGLAIAVDGTSVYVGGITPSTDFPTTAGSFRTTKPAAGATSSVGFLTKFTSSPSWSVVYSTYFGGSGAVNWISAVAVDSSGRANVAGTTTSADLPTTPGALKTSMSSSAFPDIFVTRFNAAGNVLVYSTLLGSDAGSDFGSGIALDTAGHIYVTGYSSAAVYPTTPGAFQTTNPTAGGPSFETPVVSKIDMVSTATCVPQVSPGSVNMTATGGSTSFNLTLATGCPWEAIPSSNITINGASSGIGTGSATVVNLTVNGNLSGPARTLTVRVGTATFSVNQAACPDPVITPGSLSFTPAGGSSSLTVTLPAGCPRTAVASAPWVAITSGASGTGNGTINLSISANSGVFRSATVNVNSSTASISQTGSTTPTGLGFYPVTPCRIADTRPEQGKTGAFGPPRLEGFTGRDFPIGSSCGIPPTAEAYSLNMTVVPPGPLDFLSTWPTGQPYPGVSTLNSPSGSVLANAAIVPSGTNGSIRVVAGLPTHLIVDTNGYFAPVAGQALVFYPVTPCRVVDTRPEQGKTGAFGPPRLAASTGRDIPIKSSNCGIPASAQAYSLNLTAIPAEPLGFLSVWPTGQPYPGVSTLNATDGSVIANAAIVPAGTSGAIRVVAGNPTDLVIDINGYFAPPGDPGALRFYPLRPCRVMDTRGDQGKGGIFGPPRLEASTGRNIPILESGCSVPPGARAYSLNITVVPAEPLGFLSTWPVGQPYPGVSTLNSTAGHIIANAAIVPAGTDGAIRLVAGNPTELIIDINGYFAP